MLAVHFALGVQRYRFTTVLEVINDEGVILGVDGWHQVSDLHPTIELKFLLVDSIRDTETEYLYELLVDVEDGGLTVIGGVDDHASLIEYHLLILDVDFVM